MTELLPIIFQKGVNESIDARLVPPDVHTVAQNVRWRKDGRPAKRYGSVVVDTTPYVSQGYTTQAVNAITSQNGLPVLALGASVRQQSTLGWANDNSSTLPRFGPGERDVISRSESLNPTSVSAGSAKGMVLYAWSEGTQTYYAVKSVAGAMVVPPTIFASGAGLEPRCISTTNYIYILWKNGTTLTLRVFDPTTLAVTAATSPGTLDAAGSHYDAQGRGSDFLVIYQSAAGIATTKLLSAVLSPAVTQTITTAVAVTGSRLGVMGNASSNIFVAVNEPSAGQVKVQVFNNTLTTSLGVTVVDTDINNDAMPGLSLQNNTTVDVLWGGFVAATSSSYVRAARVTAAGVVVPAATFWNVSLASKPFQGPTGLISIDGGYVWVATHNANNGSTKWDTQRGYYLVQYTTFFLLSRHAHVPNVAPGTLGQTLLADVLALGTGIGFLTPVLNALRFGNGQAELRGIDSVTVRSIYESMRMAARDTATAGRALQFSGGALFELTGDLNETGFSNAPVIQSITGGGGGALTGTTNYIYRAVYEYVDTQGRRHRSAASDPVAFASGANTSATLVLKRLFASSHVNGETLHVYRTISGQGTFHRVTPNTGAPGGSPPGAATTSFSDLMADTVAAGNEFIYTDGGVVDNTLPPPCTFLTVCNARVWLAGQLDRCVLTASKILVDGEPTQFSDELEFSVFLPEKCTGIASIDGTVVAFARERIYFVTGDGPNDQGVGSFNPPTELPTDVGCIDWRSVLETSIGIFFQGKRGIYLLPRGFNTPEFIGAAVESTLASFPIVLSATLVSQPSSGPNALGEITARFVVAADEVASSTRVLVYDLRTGGWSVDMRSTAVGKHGLAGTWNDTFVYSTTDGVSGAFSSLRAESPGTYDDGPDGGANPTFIVSSLGTGDVRPFGVAGYGSFKHVVAVGEFRAASTFSVSVSVDGAAADVYSFTLTAADAPDGSVYLDVTPRVQTGSAIRVTAADASGSPSEGFILQGLFIETELIGKTKRLAAARRA